MFRITVVEDVDGVSICGALKSTPAQTSDLRITRSDTLRRFEDIVAMAAGFIDGLGWGDNSKGNDQRRPSTVVDKADIFNSNVFLPF